MALQPKNAPGMDNSNPATYPQGDMVSGVTDVSVELHSDVIQVFVGAMEEAGITYSDTKDNKTNGYQLLEAIKKSVNNTALDLTATGEIVAKSGVENVQNFTFGKASQNNSNLRIEAKFESVESASSTSTVFEFPNLELPAGNVGQRLETCFVNDVIEVAKVVQLSPLRIEVFASLGAATHVFELAGNLIRQ